MVQQSGCSADARDLQTHNTAHSDHMVRSQWPELDNPQKAQRLIDS